MNPLVTIITPVYNGEKFIGKLLDSILLQDYPNLQFIVMDDGSIDNTREIINSYIDKFYERNIDFKYIYQENQGQSFALKNALKYVEGHYLTWPDSDDYYYKKDCITKLVQPLIYKGYKISRCLPIFFNEKEFFIKKEKISFGEELFEECLYAKSNFWFQPGCYMIDYNTYLAINPNLDFYCERETGQNWQFYLPLFFKYKCYTIQENLFAICERVNSHSRIQYYNVDRIERKYRSYINTLKYTLRLIDVKSNIYNEYIFNIEKQYYKCIFNEVVLVDRVVAKDLFNKYLIFFDEKLKYYLKTTVIYLIYIKFLKYVGVI